MKLKFKFVDLELVSILPEKKSYFGSIIDNMVIKLLIGEVINNSLFFMFMFYV